MEDQFLAQIGEGIYMIELEGERNKVQALKKLLDHYIKHINLDLETASYDRHHQIECERKIELFIHIIEKLNEFISRDKNV